MRLEEAVGKVLEGWTLPNSVRKILEEAYFSEPQRTWVGLTDEERNHIWYTVGNSDAHGDVDGWSGRDVMNAIETKLKEKNHG